MKIGDQVYVTDVNDNTLLRVVVAIENGYAYVSKDEEIRRARAEEREPTCIGFPLSSIVAP